jgi:DNA-binding NarL/FixJ family response regulator
MKKTNIMLIEDSPEYRESVVLALSTADHITVSHQFGTADQALHFLETDATGTLPTLILLDLRLPGLSGIDALPHLKTHAPGVPIIVLSQSDREVDVVHAIIAGASGYLLKSSTCGQLLEGIHSVLEGGAPIDPKVARFILNTLRNTPLKSEEDDTLSDRELDVLALLGEGLVKKEIANRLDISTHTVDNYMRRIYEKLQVPNGPAAVAKAYRSGIFS